MGISQLALARLYLLALAVGACLGIFYDALRLTRVFFGVRYTSRSAKHFANVHLPLLKPKKDRTKSPLLGTLIFFEDLFFGLLCGASMILLFYSENNGKIRMFAFVCAIIGFWIYRATLAKLVMLFSEAIVFALETAIRYLFFFCSFPFRFSGRFLWNTLDRFGARIGNAERKKKRIAFTEREQKRLAQACGMIPHENQKGSLKRGRAYGTAGKKAVQPEYADANCNRGHCRGLHRRVRKQRDEV